MADTYTISLPDTPPYKQPKTSPYGDRWDVLWLGHCGTELPGEEPEMNGPGHARASNSTPLRITIPKDPTVPVPQHLKPHPFALQDSLAQVYPPHTRVVHASSATLCTQAYAVSQAGARKLLHKFGLETFTTGWDLMLRDWCDGLYIKESSRGLPSCLTVQPPLFSHWLFDKEASSDIQAQGGGYLHRSGSQYVRLSVRQNLGRLTEGRGIDELVDQWADLGAG